MKQTNKPKEPKEIWDNKPDVETESFRAMGLTKKQKLKPHIIDGIKSLREKKPDVKQAEHNFFEIAEHLSIDISKDL